MVKLFAVSHFCTITIYSAYWIGCSYTYEHFSFTSSFSSSHKDLSRHDRHDVYSKVSIIRPGCSRLLEFEKKDSTGRLIETFSKYPDQVV